MKSRRINVQAIGIQVVLGIIVVGGLAGCGHGPESDQSYFSGLVSVSSEVDSTGDYSGFEIAILNADTDNDVDTLGYAMSAEDGSFSMFVDASERGIYPLEIRRNDRLLARDQFVVSPNDSASIVLEFPMNRNMIIVRSNENGAWMAYRNTKALHNQRLADLSTSSTATLGNLKLAVLQAAQIMWSLNETYPGTIGSELARAESVVMLEGWNDSLVVERASSIGQNEIGYSSILQALRRSTARLFGVDAAVDSLRQHIALVNDPELRDAIKAEIVLAYLDSMDVARSREVADELRTQSSSESWKQWAESAIFEMDNLMPGMAAPNPSFKDLSGRDLELDFFKETTILLEFINPGDLRTILNQQERTDLLKLSDGTNLQVITVSLNRDRVANEIYLDNKTTSEAYIVPEEGVGSEIARVFNVQSVPKRFLIDDGKIVAKYSGSSVAGIRQDILDVIN